MRRLYRWRRFEHVPLAAPADQFEFVTSDADWVRRLMAAPEAAAAFHALAEYRTAAGQGASVYFDPESAHYASPLLGAADVTAQRIGAALDPTVGGALRPQGICQVTGLSDFDSPLERPIRYAPPAALTSCSVCSGAAAPAYCSDALRVG